MGGCHGAARSRTAVSAGGSDPFHRAGALRRRARPADHQPARPYRSALVRRERAVSRSRAAVRHARSLRLPDAVLAGRAAGGSGRAPRRWRAGRDRRRARSGGCFAENYHLFRGTPSRMWLDHAFAGRVRRRPSGCRADTADAIYDHIADCLAKPEFRPRALFERFNIEAIATTESALDDLRWHRMIRDSGWTRQGRHRLSARCGGRSRNSTGFADNVATARRDDRRGHRRPGTAISRRTATAAPIFKEFGATSSDHGHPTARTEDLPPRRGRGAVRQGARRARARADEADAFRGQMLTEMARMSLDDGLVLQIHPGSLRNHSGRDRWPASAATRASTSRRRTDYVSALKPLLDAVGHGAGPDDHPLHAGRDDAMRRELAPLAGVYPCAEARAALVVLTTAPRG